MSSEASAKEDVGETQDLKSRLADHNAGKSAHTAKFRPWKVVTYLAFSERRQALVFERYLKSGSGHAFAKRRLWPAVETGAEL
jgi:putative endonuclease